MTITWLIETLGKPKFHSSEPSLEYCLPCIDVKFLDMV